MFAGAAAAAAAGGRNDHRLASGDGSTTTAAAYVRRALNKTFIGAEANNLWPLCSLDAAASSSASAAKATTKTSGCSLFDEAMGPLAWLDVFVRIKRFNAALRRSHGISQQLGIPLSASAGAVDSSSTSSTLLPGVIIVGACSESIVDIAHRSVFIEALAVGFAERHQVEVVFDAFGRRSRVLCAKSGGIYGHSNRGLYSPLCHRLQRQRDFVWLAETWVHELGGGGGGGGSSAAPPPAFAVSVHHGNLFGALRYQEELLWETDGDFDLIGLRSTHDDLMARMERLVARAREKGFEIVVTYPEKPWYVAFKRDKTDFQINARSPLSAQTRGKPAQVHNVTVPYQGRGVFMNGFGNPWRSVRTDPGHDYRELYLAQQGWVLHFTKNSVACAIEGHNACVPDCRSAQRVVDHDLCTDDMFTHFDRNPLLWFDDEASPVFFREPMPASRFVATTVTGAAAGVAAATTSDESRYMDERELFDVSRGETRKWMATKGWQFA